MALTIGDIVRLAEEGQELNAAQQLIKQWFTVTPKDYRWNGSRQPASIAYGEGTPILNKKTGRPMATKKGQQLVRRRGMSDSVYKQLVQSAKYAERKAS